MKAKLGSIDEFPVMIQPDSWAVICGESKATISFQVYRRGEPYFLVMFKRPTWSAYHDESYNFAVTKSKSFDTREEAEEFATKLVRRIEAQRRIEVEIESRQEALQVARDACDVFFGEAL